MIFGINAIVRGASETTLMIARVQLVSQSVHLLEKEEFIYYIICEEVVLFEICCRSRALA